MQNYTRISAHQFADLATAGFDVEQYSRLKFGCHEAAAHMGREVADVLYATHGDVLLANQSVVISSPYNYVKNAATIMTEHMVARLNYHLVFAQGSHVDYSIIHRKVSYTNDYGFLSKKQRRGLIDNDSFYLNREFLVGKHLIFVDDVRITGTHEDKLREVLIRDGVANDATFVYYADYLGNQADIEAALNFKAVKTFDDFVALTQTHNHGMIVRPLKYLLSQPIDVLEPALTQCPDQMVKASFDGCLAEAYYTIPQYQPGFKLLTAECTRRGLI